MKQTITQINPSSAAKVVSVTAAILIALVMLIAFAVSALGYGSDPFIPNGLPSGAAWAIATTPFIYMIGAYVTTFVFCHVLNIAIRLFGGVRIELSE